MLQAKHNLLGKRNETIFCIFQSGDVTVGIGKKYAELYTFLLWTVQFVLTFRFSFQRYSILQSLTASIQSRLTDKMTSNYTYRVYTQKKAL